MAEKRNDTAIIALDVGGSSVKSGLVHPDQQVTAITQTAIDSGGDSEQILSTLTDCISQHLENESAIRGVGIGFPGPFDYEHGICLIEGVAKYEAIYGVDISAAIRQRLGQPDLAIRFRNDAEAAIVGEARYGSGRLYRRFLGITLGTGIGSAFIVDGERVSDGMGVPESGFLFPEMFRGKQADDWFGARGLLQRLNETGEAVDSIREATSAATAGNNALREAFANYGADLGAFLQPYLTAFNAEALIVLGGIANAIELFGDTLSARVPVPVQIGSLGERAALLGAAALFFAEDD